MIGVVSIILNYLRRIWNDYVTNQLIDSTVETGLHCVAHEKCAGTERLHDAVLLLLGTSDILRLRMQKKNAKQDCRTSV